MTEATPIRVVVVDDDMFVRQALGASLDAHPDFVLVGRCESGASAIALVDAEATDVVLMDVQMPVMDGIRATGVIRAAHPRTRVLLMTSFDDDRTVQAGMAHGASGFLLKSASPESLMASLKAVHSGAFVLSPEPALRLAGHRASVAVSPGVALTDSERHVLALVCQGGSNGSIAADLYLSESTVKLRIASVGAKLGTTTRISTAIRALELGLLDERRR